MLKHISKTQRSYGVVVPVIIPWNHNHLPSFFCPNSGDEFPCPDCIYPEGANLLPDIDNNSDSVLGKAASDFFGRCTPNWGIAVAAIDLSPFIRQPNFPNVGGSHFSFATLH